MPCNTCDTPASSGGNLPAKSSAYLTDPVTAPADSCGAAPADPCAIPVSRRRYLQDYIPGWLSKLTGAAKGKMLIGVGDVLHFFKGDNPGPLYFDGQDVTVAEQPTLTAAATAESVHERGFLTLARKVKRPKVMPNGTVVEKEYYEHGVQALREIGFGEMIGLTADGASGQVRIDVIAPEKRDIIKKGLPDGMRRFGWVPEMVDNGCGLAEVKKFIDYNGAVYADSEVIEDVTESFPPALVLKRDIDGNYSYALGTQAFVETEGITAEMADVEGADYRVPVLLPVYGDAACPGKITGYKHFHIEFPPLLYSDGGYESHFFTETWLFEKYVTASLAEVTEQISVAGLVPEGARYAYIYAEVLASLDLIIDTTSDTRLIVHEEGNADNFIAQLRAFANYSFEADWQHLSFWVPLNEDKEFTITSYLETGTFIGPLLGHVKMKLVGWKR
jgi:hypothetical protein